MSAETKLWIISIPGPDDIYAAPSYEVAQLMKASHDEWVKQWAEEQKSKLIQNRIDPEWMLAVIEECDDAEEHAELLTEFKYSDWGITEADFLEPGDESQPQLFQPEGGAA